MPNTKQLIYLRGKSGGFKLRDDIKSFGFDKGRGKYYVRFDRSEHYLYYKPTNVDVLKFVRQLEPPFRVKRKSDGEMFFKVLGVRVFEGREHNAYRIIFENGIGKSYPSEYLSIEEHIDNLESENVWEYLKEVAKYNVIPIDNDNNISLADKYARVEFVTKDSLLEAYLNVATHKEAHHKSSKPIFPFGCNRSQYKAVKNALENNLSIIQGPPGTGKTQTILNIMANLLLEGKTMQIVSNNNSAVENIKDKLKFDGLDFLCAQLGRASNKTTFIDAQTGLFPDMSSWKQENIEAIRQEAITLSNDIQKLFEYEEKFATYSEQLREYKRQASQFPQSVESKKHFSTNKLEKFFLLVNHDFELKQRVSWWTKFRLRCNGIPNTDMIPDKLQYLLITAKISELEKKCEYLNNYVSGAEGKHVRLQELSINVLKDHLSRIYDYRKARVIFSSDEIYQKPTSFLNEYPIVLSTTFSSTSNICQSKKFDYLIIDEASQVDVATGALALSCSDNVVIVGDLKQLPNVVESHTLEITDSIFKKYNIPEAYRYSTNSFLSSICNLFPSAPQILLREHYRCDPLIIGFCSKHFYDGKLIPMKESSSDFLPVRVIRTTKGNHARGSINLRQVETITQEILPTLEKNFSDIGIIAPYNNQVDAIQNAIKAIGRDYPSATVHKFQGRENDVIILSTVDNQIQEFTDDPHLLNVAVSRAKKQFILVVSGNEQPDSHIRDLIDYIEYYQGNREQSSISSIFDLLYESHTQELAKFFRKHRRISEYDSESLAYWAIRDVIKEQGFTNRGLLMHYPLHHLITSSSELTPEQRAYATHPWTHVDFLIYNTLTHKAKLAIEVDGTQYHRSDSRQGQRDIMKDAILKSIGLPLLRLSTAGSQEKIKIAHALAQDL
ncbi:MAG: AAA domain-containing protein [Bacteroidales bacterium]|nr:AAA domain-containing protein [Bacteroidales bacterium]